MLKFRFWPGEAVIVQSYQGHGSPEQLRRFYEMIAQEPEFDGLCDMLIDLRGLTSTSWSAQDVLKASMRLNIRPAPRRRLRYAMIAPGELALGMANMFAGFAGVIEGMQARSFVGAPEATAWLGLQQAPDHYLDTTGLIPVDIPDPAHPCAPTAVAGGASHP